MPHFGYITIIVVQQAALFVLLWIIARLIERGPGGVKRADGKAHLVALQRSSGARDQKRGEPAAAPSKSQDLVSHGV
jgi:hypothetical protein